MSSNQQPSSLFALEQYNAPSIGTLPMEEEPLSPKAIRARSLVGTSEGRPAGDFYPTPEGATEALLREVDFIPGHIWEPACGEGDICRVLSRWGYKVTPTDLIDRGYGTAPVDFLKTKTLLAEAVVTNPPFTLAEQFAAHALKLGARQLALFGKLAFLEGQERSAFLERSPLKTVYIFRNRISLYRNGIRLKNTGMIAFAWYYWEQDWSGPPLIKWVENLKKGSLRG